MTLFYIFREYASMFYQQNEFLYQGTSYNIDFVITNKYNKIRGFVLVQAIFTENIYIDFSC